MTAQEEHSLVVSLMATMREWRPRSLKKLYGSRGLTDEQRAEWEARMRSWRSEYSKLSRQQKTLLAQANEEGRKEHAQHDSG
jgi:hypothetical protein